MKKIVILMLAVALLLLCSCTEADVISESTKEDSKAESLAESSGVNETDDPSFDSSIPDESTEEASGPNDQSFDESSTVEPVEDSLEPVEDPSESEAIGGSLEGMDRYYSDELNDIYILSKIVSWDEITKWENDVYFKQSDDEMNQLPNIYQAIKGLNISREDFTRENAKWIAFNKEHGTGQSTYTDREIEIMFTETDENIIKRELKKGSTYYYEGRLYTVYELLEVKDELFKEMIQQGGLEEFSSEVERYIDGSEEASAVRKLQSRVKTFVQNQG